MPDAPYHYACDFKWWDLHYHDVRSAFRGASYTINDLEDKGRNPSKDYDLIRLKSRYGEGLSKEFIHYGVSGGGNSGFQAINLAYQLGAKTILLLGFDMFGTHYFGNHPKELGQSSPFAGFIKSFETITEVEIVNCSRMTALNCFPKMRIESALL